MITAVVRLQHCQSSRQKQMTSLLIFQQTSFRLRMDRYSWKLTCSMQDSDQPLTWVFRSHEWVVAPRHAQCDRLPDPFVSIWHSLESSPLLLNSHQTWIKLRRAVLTVDAA